MTAPVIETRAPAGEGTLLTYSAITYPEILESDPDRPQTLADVILVVSNTTSRMVRVDKLEVEFSIGGSPQDLATAAVPAERIFVDGSNWLHRVGNPPADNIITFTPNADEDPLAGGITIDYAAIRLTDVPINTAPGIAYLQLREWAEYGHPVGDEPEYELRRANIKITKFAAGTGSGADSGTGSDLRAYLFPYTPGDAPVTSVAPGSDVLLRWDAIRDVAYNMHYRDQDEGIMPDPGTRGTWKCPEPLVSDTTFTLQTVSQHGGDPTVRYDTLTVAVTEPTYPGLTVQDGAITASPSGLSVIGPVVAEKDLRVTSTVDAAQGATITDLSITATANLRATTIEIGERLTATGHLKSTANTIATDLSCTGDLTATGKVRLLGTPSRLTDTRGTASTDGFIIGFAKRSDARGGTISAETDIPEGSTGGFRKCHSTVRALGNERRTSFCLLVRRGESWATSFSAGLTKEFWWIPFGV
ncbi:hypothetical protein ACFVSN_30330 [Kitasatospora sp. NPDC057904]|uniref:hypothetical protein n=1 Tax=unclassified Kitasatospora TaxID=2633591 RepID=UPI0036DC78E3